MADCFLCKGKNPRKYCGREYCPIYQKFSGGIRKIDLDFSGNSPPDIFVGRANYPHVFTGILAPVGHVSDSMSLSSSEEWFKNDMGVGDILAARSSLVYSRFVSAVKGDGGKLLEVMKEVSMAQKPCDLDFYLKKKPKVDFQVDKKVAPIGNVAPLRKVLVTSNPKIHKKVDYVVSDDDLRAVEGVMKLYFSNASNTTGLIRLLSAGLLGLKKNRKLTPSRWAITAVDSLVSDELIKKIKRYSWIDNYKVFSGEYLGNHYEFILIPRQFSFEVIEANVGDKWKVGGSWFMQDYEDVFKRKKYASEVTGGYYAVRLPVCEYLEGVRKQASVLVLREVKPEYYAPLGVGILRELSRGAFKLKCESFDSLGDALKCVGARMRIPIEEFVKRSKLMGDMREQSMLFKFGFRKG